MSTNPSNIQDQFELIFTPDSLDPDPQSVAEKWVWQQDIPPIGGAFYNSMLPVQTTGGSLVDETTIGKSIPIGNKTLMLAYMRDEIFIEPPGNTSVLAERYWNASALFWSGGYSWAAPDPAPDPVIMWRGGNPYRVIDLTDKASFLSQMQTFLDSGASSPDDFFVVLYLYFIQKISTEDGFVL